IAVGGDGHVATWDLASSALQIDCATGLTWEDSVWSVEFSPDSTQLATGGVPNANWTDCKLTLWDATVPQTIPYTRTGYQARVGGCNGNYMNAVHFSPDGAYLLSVNQDSCNYLWDGETLAQIRPVPPQLCSTKDGAWNSDGREAWVVSLCGDTPYAGGELHLASVARDPFGNTVGWPGGVDHWIENPQDTVYGCAFSKDLSYTATGGGPATKTVKLWNRNTGRLVWTSAAGTDIMFSVAISPNNQFVACGNRYQVWLLNGSTGAQVYALPTTLRWVGSVGIPLNSLSFSPDSSKVAVLCGDGRLRVYNTGTGVEMLNIPLTYDAYCVAFSADGSRLAVGGAAHVATWEVATGTKQIDCTTGLTWEDNVFSVSFSPDGTRMITGGTPNSTWNDAKITLWDATVPGGQLPVTRSTYLWRLSNKHGNYINAVRFTPDGRFLASAANDNLAYIFDAVTGTQIRALPGQSSYIKDAMWSADGSELWLETPVSSVMGTALRLSSFGGADVSMPFLTVLYPRLTGQSSPVITSLANGKGAQVQHSWGTDTILMSDTPFTYNENGIAFTGRVAVIRNMNNETWMNLIDGTSLSWNGRTLTAPGLTRWQLT
ncbi:MAG TPA: WD40 repeat domain-containing protein, partial [Armatimonadota bacterium]